MSDPKMIKGIQEAVSIPVMAKCRIGHFAEAQILQAIEIDYIDESEVLSPADDKYHIDKTKFEVPFVCGAKDLGEALRRISEGASMIRTKGEPGTGDVVQAVRHMRTMQGEIRRISSMSEDELYQAAKDLQVDYDLVRYVAENKRLPVVNFAAESHVDRSIDTPEVFLKTNILGTQVLLDACNRFGTGRYHQVSTDEVYGDLPLDRPDLFFTEETPIHTSSPYSASKASADLLVTAYYRTYGTPVTISRCSNNYGPYHFPEKLIPLMIANALNDKPLPVYGKGENVRDWLYVEDHCKAIDLIIHKGRVGEVYNIGGHNEMKNIDIVKIICKELGKPESLITYVTDRKGHDMRYAIDPTKIHNELGWLPETKFADGIKKTIQWYLDNKEWWETIISGEYQNYYEKMYGDR